MALNFPARPLAPDLNSPSTYNARVLDGFTWCFDTMPAYLEGLEASEFISSITGATINGSTIGLTTPAAAAFTNVSLRASATETRSILVGAGRTGNGSSYVDLIGDTVYSYGARFLRGAGENSSTSVLHRGTGNMDMTLEDSGAFRVVIGATASLRVTSASAMPGPDNAISLGGASNRWSVVYAGTGTINTSDAAAKTDVAPLDAAELAVAQAAKALIRKYRFVDAVASKGAGARIHFGVIAQDLAAAFEAEGLNPWSYGVMCRDQWWEADVVVPETIDEEGNVLMPASIERRSFATEQEAPEGAVFHERYGVRYDELFAFILAAI